MKYEAGLEPSKIKGKDVLLLDDIVYSGKTLEFLKERIASKGARSIRTYVLIDAKEKASTTTIDGSCFKGEHYKYYFGVGLDAPTANGIEAGKHKQNIYDGGLKPNHNGYER